MCKSVSPRVLKLTTRVRFASLSRWVGTTCTYVYTCDVGGKRTRRKEEIHEWVFSIASTTSDYFCLKPFRGLNLKQRLGRSRSRRNPKNWPQKRRYVKMCRNTLPAIPRSGRPWCCPGRRWTWPSTSGTPKYPFAESGIKSIYNISLISIPL